MVSSFVNQSYCLLKKNKIDLIFVAFCVILLSYFALYIDAIKVPIHDGAVYLLNARSWFYNTEIYEDFRPQLLSWIIAGIWALTGENWIITKYIQCIFTVAAGIILYILLRKPKGAPFALGVSVLTMTNATVFTFSTQIITEGLALFFLVLTLYFLKSQRGVYWFLAGITIGLTFAARYPVIVQALTIFIVEALVMRRYKQIFMTVLSTSLVVTIVISAIYLKTGVFETALAKDTVFSPFLSPFYLVNSIDIWGFAFILVPIALLYKNTYKNAFNYSFIAWFIVSLIFWSANQSNYQYRFTIQFTPAVYFLSMLGIESFFHYMKSRRNNNNGNNNKSQ